jgi:hypothetical protein
MSAVGRGDVRYWLDNAPPITRQARFLRVTFPEPGKILLNIGPGDHSVDRWEISEEQLRLFILDAMPNLLKSVAGPCGPDI